MNDRYILKNKEPVLETDLLKWASWFETADRIVAKTKVGKQEVSTVFLGLDHNFGKGKPLLFETMIFPECEYCKRYSTWQEAEEGHKKAVKKIGGK